MLDQIKPWNKSRLSQNLEPNNRCTNSSKQYQSLTVFTIWTINDPCCCVHFQTQKQRLEKVKWFIHSHNHRARGQGFSLSIHLLSFKLCQLFYFLLKIYFYQSLLLEISCHRKTLHFSKYYIISNFAPPKKDSRMHCNIYCSKPFGNSS